MEPRIILFHQQATSARTRFLRHAYGSVCAFEPLPAAAQVVDAPAAAGRPAWHPAAAVTAAGRRLGLAGDALEPQGGFVATVEAADAVVPVFLARFTSVDPPFDLAERLGARFIDLTQARDLPAVELALLRRGYELVMGS